MSKSGILAGVALLSMAGAIAMSCQALAQRYESPNYTIDASVGNSFGGDSSSASYQLISSGGESIIGNGSGGSYMLGQGYVAELERSLQLSVQPQGLVAYYPFEELEGKYAYDSSVNSHDGELTNQPARVSGQVGRALSFDGTADSVTAYDLGIEGVNTITLAGWAKVDSDQTCADGLNPIVSGGDSAQNGIYVWGDDCGRAGFKGASGATAQGVVVVDPAGFDPYQWNHFMAVSSTSGMYLYLNGQLIGSNTTDFTPIDMDSALPNIISGLEIGHNPNSATRYFDGQIDEIKIYSRALSAREAKAEYDAGMAGHSAGLVFGEEIISGNSQIVDAEAVIQTDAPGYSLTIEQDGDLTKGSDTIPGAVATVASPANWSEGVTTGLGFTVASASATAPDAKWNSGNAYAGLPAAATSFYNRSGYSGGTKDLVTIRYRLDVESPQPSGQYQNVVTYTGVMTP